MILINASNLSKGGGLANAISFIQYIIDNNKDGYKVIAHKNVVKGLRNHQNVIECSVENLIGGEWFKLNLLILKLKPTTVYTIFGPAFLINPFIRHISGFAQGHLIYKDSPYFKEISVLEKIKWKIKSFIFRYLFRLSDEFIVESADAGKRLILFLRSKKKIYVLNNAPNELFYRKEIKSNNSVQFIIGLITADYPHKNIPFVIKVAEELIAKNIDVLFKFTLDKKDQYKNLKNIEYLGSAHGSKLVDIYDQCDAIILPSSLETFPGNIIETFLRKKILLGPDLTYLKNLCEGAYVSYEYGNIQDCTRKIIELKKNDYPEAILSRSQTLCESFLSTSQKYNRIDEILQE